MKQQDILDFLKIKRGTVITKKLAPAQILVSGFLLVIFVATVLLMLPISSRSGQATTAIDALFTATSAVCVTGLSVVNTLAHWSVFGKVVILFCIQIGGLGFMTLVSMMFIVLGKRITLKNRLLMQEALNTDTTAGIVRFTRYIVIGTFLVEAIGALFLAFVFVPEHGFVKGVAYSIFHSISAFCNAGFDLVGPDSLTPYVGNGMINITITLLVVIGGLGFSVWVDTIKMIKFKHNAPKHFKWKQAFHKLSLHSRLVWLLTIGLLVIGFVFIFVVEYTNPNTLGMLTFKEKVYAALFQSMSPRTAGFNTIALAELTDSSKLMTMLLMIIGGSPAGTAGGVKTVTVGVLFLCMYSTLKGEEETLVFKRKIPFQIITRALTIIMIAIGVVLVMVMVLSFTENFTFIEILFEVISAFGTVGTTLGITSKLSFIGKVAIIITMFIGRLGTITIAVALMIKQGKEKGLIGYPEEKVMVG